MAGVDDILIGVALKYTPDLIGSVFGEKSGQAAKELVNTVEQLTGKKTPEDALAALDGSSEMRAELQKLAMDIKKSADERAFQARMVEQQTLLAEFQARMQDINSARQQTLELSRAGSIIAWGAPIVSSIVLGTFLLTLYLAFTYVPPPQGGGHEQLINLMAGALTTMATAVVGYWVGTSASSAQKTNLLAMAPSVGPVGAPASKR